MKTIMKFVYLGFVSLALACFAVLPRAQAVSPVPDGCYPGFTTAEGCGALNSLTSGAGNTGVGWSSLLSDTTGNFNTGVGAGALISNNGDSNTAVGAVALLLNTTGTQNTAVGTDAMVYNTTGEQNTAVGFQALYSNTTGGDNGDNDGNTAIGSHALYSNTTGYRNTAIGEHALELNTVAHRNTAIGGESLAHNTTGIRNAASGYFALGANTTGDRNTANGSNVMNSNTTGSFNIASGYAAGSNLTTGDNNIDIGNIGVAGEANTIRIGEQIAETDNLGILHPAHTTTYIAGISGQTASGGVAVYIDSDGKLGTLTSSARFKDEIKPMDEASEAVLALKPVTFRYKHEIDPRGIPQFGLVAEDVEKVNPELVARDADGKPYTVRYEAVNAMLLNEFLKEHRKVEQLEKQLEALAAGLQKVSAQIEMSRPAPQVVENRQ